MSGIPEVSVPEDVEKPGRFRARHWRDLSRGRQIAVLVGAAVQITLAATAWIDLAKRPAGTVNGSKRLWAAIIGVNYVGPIAYFLAGRRR
ncbi:PLDc N-terminal domain-containing protein [Cryobacterium cryoconiti]|uniref:Cardiolipin synthase N-terminal domain-containing protein n=1 Tax=Cryobacterium cryoconiti TaxID=1259239 RepID=A0A4Y8JYI1_9MICO|nr:PLDc N-terminal domain-containing protein [Cryobacterium cryoconiti]TFD29621.1 hypothetical protein E3T49_09365 [Cryobacterium cryoconiti]